MSKVMDECFFETAEFGDELEQMRSDELVAQAQKHYIYPKDLGFAEQGWDWYSMVEDTFGDEHEIRSVWERGMVGNRWLNGDAERELHKRLHGAERERRRERRETFSFWMSLCFGFVGAIIAFLQAATILLPDLLRILSTPR